MKVRHAILGTAGWLAALAAGIVVLRTDLSRQSSSLSTLASDVGQWVTGQRAELTAHCAVPLGIALDDPIFMETADGRFRQVGHVSRVDGTRNRDPLLTSSVQIVLYDKAVGRCLDGWRLDYFTTPMNLDWVVMTMIPPQRQKEIAELIRSDWEKHQRELQDHLQPVMRKGVRRALRAVESELESIIRAHSEEFRSLGDRFAAEILEENLLPVIRDKVFPVVQEEIRPLALDTGRALWNRVSLWSFTWRYLYDVSPLPERNALRAEFERFINDEALPELESRTEHFIDVTRRVMQRLMQNPVVRESFRENFRRIAEDRKLQQIVWTILREATVENETLRQELEDYWKSQETRSVVGLASARLEPTVRGIGDLIFGTREKGITSEFSRILRSQILQKDRRWFVIVPDSTASVVSGGDALIAPADQPMLFPLKFSGTHQSPLTKTEYPAVE